jgi:DNA-binding transcriptional LysR family regulator
LRLSQIEYLLALRKYGSISKAAENLYVSQPTISNSIKELEHELNCAIVNRSNRGCAFTPKGIKILESAMLISKEIDIIYKIAKHDDSTADLVKIAGPTHLSSLILTNVVMDLNKKFPSLTCDLRIGNGITLLEQLYNGNLDFAIIYSESIPKKDCEFYQKAGIIFDVLFKDILVIGCRPDHPLAGRTIDPEELLQYPFAFLFLIPDSPIAKFLESHNYTKPITQILEPASVRKFACSSDALVPMSATTLYSGNMIYQYSLAPINLRGSGWDLTVSLAHWKNHSDTIAQIIKKTVSKAEKLFYEKGWFITAK